MRLVKEVRRLENVNVQLQFSCWWVSKISTTNVFFVRKQKLGWTYNETVLAAVSFLKWRCRELLEATLEICALQKWQSLVLQVRGFCHRSATQLFVISTCQGKCEITLRIRFYAIEFASEECFLQLCFSLWMCVRWRFLDECYRVYDMITSRIIFISYQAYCGDNIVRLVRIGAYMLRGFVSLSFYCLKTLYTFSSFVGLKT